MPFRKFFFLLLTFLAVNSCFSRDNQFPNLQKVICVGQRSGCACRKSPGPSAPVQLQLYHLESVEYLDSEGSYSRVKVRGHSCYYPSSQLDKSEYTRILHAKVQDKDHTPLPFEKLTGKTMQELRNNYQGKNLGFYWPTFYHMAMEEFHPGKKVPYRNNSGKILGYASQEFLRQVVWEGSGVTENGTKLHYTGKKWRYEKYNLDWGYGAGYGYQIFPYRTIAIHFREFCKKFSETIPHCRKKDAIGTLVYIPEIAKKKIQTGSVIHDGFFCANDTGSPYYIRGDRIDIFVGLHGGGNPYLPKARNTNWLIDGGVQNIVPSDWRIWRSKENRVWCPKNQIPKDPFHPSQNECTHDYHVMARQKSLHLQVFLDSHGRPVKCLKNPKP